MNSVGLESDPTMQVYGYDNPVTALVEFTPNFYDLLLIDINMPLMDGFQLAQNLYEEPQCPGLFYNCWRNKYGSGKEKCIHSRVLAVLSRSQSLQKSC